MEWHSILIENFSLGTRNETKKILFTFLILVCFSFCFQWLVNMYHNLITKSYYYCFHSHFLRFSVCVAYCDEEWGGHSRIYIHLHIEYLDIWSVQSIYYDSAKSLSLKNWFCVFCLWFSFTFCVIYIFFLYIRLVFFNTFFCSIKFTCLSIQTLYLYYVWP